MALIRGTSHAIVTSVFRPIDPPLSNALRMLLASAVLAAASGVARRTTLREIFHTWPG